MAIGAPEAMMMVGGATSSGPTRGIYHIEVRDAAMGKSSQKGTPFIELELWVKDDPDNVAKEGKRLMKQRFYGPGADADEDKKQTMMGMLRRGLFRGFNVPWPKQGVALDHRKFVGKQAWILVDKESKPQDPDDVRMEVKRITQDRAKLETVIAVDEQTPPVETQAKPSGATRARR